MATSSTTPNGKFNQFLRPRTLIIIAVALIVIGLLLRGLLTPSASPSTSSKSTPGPAAPLIGHYAPGVTVVDLSGNKVTLASLHGKVVALNFWYAACEPCKLEMPALERAYEKHKTQGLVILGIDVTDDASTTASFVRLIGVTYPVVRDQSLATVTAYNVTATPSTFFIDRDGVIRSKIVGALDLTTLEPTVSALLT